jgi:uncharacterized protein YndB with AHSA1/START domain
MRVLATLRSGSVAECSIGVVAACLVAAPAPAGDLEPIVSVGVVKAPLSAVWNAWATSDGPRSWLAPVADIDRHVGGLMRTNDSRKGSLGDEGTRENRILAIEPQRMLANKVDKTPVGFAFPVAVKSMCTVIYLQEHEGGQTSARTVGMGFADDPESVRMRGFLQTGNDMTLKQLHKRIEP